MLTASRPGHRLPNRIAVALLTQLYPRAAVDAVIEEAGRGDQRHRLLPAWFMAYYVMLMALFRNASYEEVFSILADGLAWQGAWEHPPTLPTRAAIFKARRRLGQEPLRALYKRGVVPLGASGTGGRPLGRRIMSISRTRLEVPWTAANETAFGEHGAAPEGRGAPWLRLVGLVETGTGTIVDAALGPPPGEDADEDGLVAQVLGKLQPEMLCVADRATSSLALWRQAAATGADLLWPVDSRLIEVADEPLSDGARLGWLTDPSREQREAGREPVRIIGPHPWMGAGPDRDVLVTTITRPEEAAAARPVAEFTAGSAVQTALRDLAPDRDRAEVTLRSKDPEGVFQEAYGLLLVHYALRWLVHGAAESDSAGARTRRPLALS